MKFSVWLLLLISFSGLTAQNPEGSWQLLTENGQKIIDKEVIAIYQDGYFAYSAKEKDGNKFIYARGGEYNLNKNMLLFKEDFNTNNPENIGKEQTVTVTFIENTMEIVTADTKSEWIRLSDTTDELSGSWVITGRQRGKKMISITPGDRRTVKILGGGRFQWIAFNSKTKEFSGTGGGTYTAAYNIYIENISVFSRDESRVGASLQFYYDIKDGNWHHKGESSKGDPIYEIWSPYKKAYKR